MSGWGKLTDEFSILILFFRSQLVSNWTRLWAFINSELQIERKSFSSMIKLGNLANLLGESFTI